jgi:uncharacterized Zn ribbon protein
MAIYPLKKNIDVFALANEIYTNATFSDNIIIVDDNGAEGSATHCRKDFYYHDANDGNYPDGDSSVTDIEVNTSSGHIKIGCSLEIHNLEDIVNAFLAREGAL